MEAGSWLVLGVSVVGGLVALWGAFQNFLQAWLLGRPLDLATARDRDPQLLAVRARVCVFDAVVCQGVDCLYTRKRLYEHHHGGPRGGRRQLVYDKTQTAAFALVDREVSLTVDGEATEVYGLRSSRGGGGRLVALAFSRSHDEVEEWLPVPDELTVVGRTERRGDATVIVPDAKVGLLLTPAPPRRAALAEAIKGVACLAAVGFAAWLAQWVLTQPLH
jgi:hypothetical protein